jgi:peptidoglycan/xylan/chitin deacetylase (PgdA/CDA1 family)
MLAQGSLVEIGSHTATHPKLSALPPAVQRDEVYESKAALEGIVGQAVKSFAYPYGRLCDYSEETIAIVKDAGFDCACSTTQGLVRRRSHVFELPRFQAPDVSGEVLDNLLRQWFEIR